MNPVRSLKGARRPRWKLRLYVAGRLVNSRRAIDNLKQLCREHVEGPCHLEVVDVLQEPQRAIADDVLVTPALVRLAPGPRLQVIGDLSDDAVVRAALGLEDSRA
jgi:circadian clock protein KaiB